jgi:hypothetical protein
MCAKNVTRCAKIVTESKNLSCADQISARWEGVDNHGMAIAPQISTVNRINREDPVELGSPTKRK